MFCLAPHQTRYVVPAGAVTVGPRRRACGARGAGRHRRDRGQRAVGRRAAGRRPDRGGRRRDGRLLRRRAARPDPRGRGSSWSTSTRPGRRRRGARRRVRRTRRRARATATSSCTPARPTAGLTRVAGPARRRGRGDRAELVRRPPGHAAARRGVPLPAPDDAREPGRHGRARPGAAAARYADRMALALRLLADPVFDALITREIRFADLPREMPRIAGEPSGAVRACHLRRGRPDGTGSCSASPSATT